MDEDSDEQLRRLPEVTSSHQASKETSWAGGVSGGRWEQGRADLGLWAMRGVNTT